MARVEKETSINFNKFDDFANVYTTQIKIINRLNKLSLIAKKRLIIFIKLISL
jgi:hypothetical protein